MPPQDSLRPIGKADKPDGVAAKRVMDWIITELGHAGIERNNDLLERPEFGNYVDHQKLFDGGIKSPSYSVPRVWRLRAELYSIGTPFAQGEYDYAAMQSVGEPEAMRLRALSEEIADSLVEYALGRKEPYRNQRHNPAGIRAFGIPKLSHAAMYTGTSSPERKHIDLDITDLFSRLMRRQPTAEEVKRYGDFLEGMLKTESDREASLVTAIRAIVLMPESIFRMELVMGEELPDGRRMLSEQELALAVPMSLGKDGPVRGLKTREDVEKAVRSILQKNKATNGPGMTRHGLTPLYLEFMRQYFGYHKAPDVFKGDRHAQHHVKFRAGSRARPAAFHLVNGTDLIIVAILKEDKDVFRRLLTTDQVLVTYRADPVEYAKILQYSKPDFRWSYSLIPKEDRGPDVPDLSEKEISKVVSRKFQTPAYMAYYGFAPSDLAFDKNGKNKNKSGEVLRSPLPRAGVLTQPSWLIAHSTFTDNHVVLRGKWIREKLFGQSIPEVPIGVEAAIPDDDDKPLRERLAQTRDEFCWRCHQKMDPLGYPFEMYDDFGRYRDANKERLINGELAAEPLDTSGAIIGSRVPGLDGPVKDAVEMIHKIAATDRARQVFVRHVFRFFMGRNETLADSQTLTAADRAHVESGGSFEELVVSILTSDSFLYRRAMNPARKSDSNEKS
ncbi:MAG: hypothetical protein ACI9G1_000562 [Pirellulaceae bacterium]|jgi:hypothetical protein